MLVSFAAAWCGHEAAASLAESEVWDWLLAHNEEPESFFVDPYDQSIEFNCAPEALSEKTINWLHEKGFIYVHFSGHPSKESR